MKRRFVAALIVALAVLFSQGGGLVLAAVCPHLRAQQPVDNACHASSQDAVTEHHEPAETEGEAFQTNESDVRCNHCVVHSRNKRDESALQQNNTQQRANDPKVTTAFAPAGPPALETVVAFAKAHGPPRGTAPLYLLVNVFRI